MGKRFNGEGTFRERKPGLWEGRLGYTDEDGVRRRLSCYAPTERAARAKVREAAARIERGDPAKDSAKTVAQWCDHWCATTLEASTRKPTTKALMRSLINSHVKSARIGAVPLAKLRPSHFDSWVIDLRRKEKPLTSTNPQAKARALSDATIQRVFRVLSVVLDGAVRDGALAVNPARKVDQPRADRSEARVLNAREIRALLDAARAIDQDPRGWRTHSYPLFALIAATGMRKGEALALRWQDIDLDAATVTVRGTLSRVDGKLIVTAPKTRASRRVLPISQGAVQLLRTHRVAQLEDRMRAANVWVDSGHVFTTALGAPIDPRNVLRSIQAAARRAGVQDVDVHALRHSAATVMLDGGVHLKAVSTLLGHAGTQITGDIYAHLTAPTARKAIDDLGAAIGL
ncbi:site-specific integrase [Microbacterium invictum]|uniref:Site-specific integrase n=1 Tax=Microbacterium invictum TaxID=515415 RepID=A0ABZ0V8X6_9MICO|nr:site-specific integrase [Microbacterium invictum]WQB69020.1 site-specific integrase [Microbacterium invictum]